jgi:hypothetical protein
MDKIELLTAIRATHAPIEAAAALDDAALLAPATGMEGWTRKDVLAHMEWWNHHSATILEGMRSGVDPYPDTGEPWDGDAQNARILEENRARSADDVRQGEAAAFERLLAAIDAATDDELFAPGIRPWFDGVVATIVAEDSTNHYPEHVPHLA